MTTHSKDQERLAPVNPMIFVSAAGVHELLPEDISLAGVGRKTFGLTSLPGDWTLRFFGVSAELFRDYTTAAADQKAVIARWSTQIINASQRVGLKRCDQILVRSSGFREDMSARGRFYSSVGLLDRVEIAIENCLKKLAADGENCDQPIPLLIQQRCPGEKTKGHLSNERRCYEESRDWIGEFESADPTVAHSFQVNLRGWRKEFPEKLPHRLACPLSSHISEVLKIPAEWARRKGARVHFEWVWNGTFLYVVQADEEASWDGHDPVHEHLARAYSAITFQPMSLRRVTAGDNAAARFGKISNVLTYLKLGLPTAPLYILDDQSLIRKLAEGVIPDALESDISQLVKASLVIRSDLAAENISVKQLLPRTQEVRTVAEAVKWLKENARSLLGFGCDAAFLAHNFIPAVSAAFAYADPREPLVQIESLWGLPEGLYYNSHDKYMVDTLKASVDELQPKTIDRLPVREKRNFKRFFVSTTPSGKWETLTLRQPYDWKGSLSIADCRRIAYESRRIAHADGHPVSVMWFVGVPTSVADVSCIPWYHEAYDASIDRSSVATRRKTQFDPVYVIRHERDLNELKKGHSFTTAVPRIRVQPLDEKLLRDKNTLKQIGELAKRMGAIIVLEGAILSHAYYQLLGTGAVVEVVHPFIGFEERQEFNKLVRDKVPQLIRERGERITTARLRNDALVSALREKLVEEAYELLDARDLSSMIGELADVREVIDALIQMLNITPKEVDAEQHKKRESRGGFSDGVVLLKTESVPPTSRSARETQESFKVLESAQDVGNITLDETEAKRRGELLERRVDRRTYAGKIELRATVAVPVTRGPAWEAKTPEEAISNFQGGIVSGRVKGSRSGPWLNVEVAVVIDRSQPELKPIPQASPHGPDG